MPPPSLPNVRTENDQLIVEAPTAEAALELVAERLGTHAKIAGVERVRRGGVGGFFARELVQVTATAHDMPENPGPQPQPQPEPRPEVAAPQPEPDVAADTPVDRLLRELAQRDDPFATTLQRQLVPAAQSFAHVRPSPPARPSAAEQALRRPFTLPGTPAAAPPVAEPSPAPLPGTPEWTVRNLYRLGIPPLLTAEDAASIAPHDDVAWTHALADRLRPLCGPLPGGPTIVVGPPAERLAGTLDLPICWPGQQTPPESFVAPISGSHSEREWLASVRNGRPLHLVVGGPRWRGLLYDDPAVLSHDDTTMCEAISLAFGLGIRLGYTCHPSGELTRTNPIDLAVAIRRLLPTHR